MSEPLMLQLTHNGDATGLYTTARSVEELTMTFAAALRALAPNLEHQPLDGWLDNLLDAYEVVVFNIPLDDAPVEVGTRGAVVVTGYGPAT